MITSQVFFAGPTMTGSLGAWQRSAQNRYTRGLCEKGSPFTFRLRLLAGQSAGVGEGLLLGAALHRSGLPHLASDSMRAKWRIVIRSILGVSTWPADLARDADAVFSLLLDLDAFAPTTWLARWRHRLFVARLDLLAGGILSAMLAPDDLGLRSIFDLIERAKGVSFDALVHRVSAAGARHLGRGGSGARSRGHSMTALAVDR